MTQKELKNFAIGIGKIINSNKKMVDDYRKNKDRINGDWSEKTGIRR